MRRNYCKYTFGVGALFTLALLAGREGLADPAYSQRSLSTPPTKSRSTPPADSLSASPTNNVYVGLSYSPAWHRIQNFSVGASDGSTAARYPSLHNLKRRWEVSDFDLRTPVNSINFNNSFLHALEGSVGYQIGAVRVELEVGYEKFEAKSAMPGKGADQSPGAAYLLVKDLVPSLLNKQAQHLALALSKVEAQGIVDFAQAVKVTSPVIDKSICFRQVGRSKVYRQPHTYNLAKHEPWSCVDFVSKEFSYKSGIPGYPEYGVGSLSTRFGKLEGHDVKQEDSADGKKTNRGWPGTAAGKINTAQGMANDLIDRLNDEERETVARILIQKVVGAEVVKMRALTSTSVMLNTCYDLQRAKSRIMPFACLGIGANFINIVEGHFSPKLAWKVKAGVSYSLSPDLTVFASGFHHSVLSSTKYGELPVHRLVDDVTKTQTRKSATASFKMAYVGAEFGMRFTF